MSAGRTYPVGIVGEASYQSSIRRCSRGEPVEIVHEPDNPYDKRALAAVSSDGLTIGYIAKECWLQDAIHEEGKGCTARIKSIDGAQFGTLAVVLDVSLNADGVAKRAFHRENALPSQSCSAAPQRGWLSRLFGL